MYKINEKLDSIEMEINQLAEAVRVTEIGASNKTLSPKQREGIEKELLDLYDAIIDVEIQVNRKICYSS